MKGVECATACLRTVALALPMIVPITATALAQPSGDEPEVAAEPVTADKYPERRVDFPGDVIGLPNLTYITQRVQGSGH